MRIEKRWEQRSPSSQNRRTACVASEKGWEELKLRNPLAHFGDEQRTKQKRWRTFDEGRASWQKLTLNLWQGK
jgi:hypothetical protein